MINANLSRQESIASESIDVIAEEKDDHHKSSPVIVVEEPVTQQPTKPKSSGQKRPAPKPPVVETNNAAAEVVPTPPSPPAEEKTSEVEANNVTSPPANTATENGKIADTEELAEESIASQHDKSDGEITLINNVNGDAFTHNHSNHESPGKVFDGIKIENGHFNNSDSCQVTISSNHSTIINTSEVAPDKTNISIVTIEDGKNISIKSSDSFKKSDSKPKTNGFEKEEKSTVTENEKSIPKPAVSDQNHAASEKIEPAIEIAQPKESEDSIGNSKNDSIGRTMIKVNLKLLPENNGDSQTKPATKNDLLTRIDQVTPINNSRSSHWNSNESKNLKRESSNSSSCFSSISSSDKENANHIVPVDDQPVSLRKKREMVCLLSLSFSRVNCFANNCKIARNLNTNAWRPIMPPRKRPWQRHASSLWTEWWSPRPLAKWLLATPINSTKIIS